MKIGIIGSEDDPLFIAIAERIKELRPEIEVISVSSAECDDELRAVSVGYHNNSDIAKRIAAMVIHDEENMEYNFEEAHRLTIGEMRDHQARMSGWLESQSSFKWKEPEPWQQKRRKPWRKRK